MKKSIIIAALAAIAFAQTVSAQTNLQTFYDFGKDRQYITTTFEMFKGDQYGDTFFFIDHYYSQSKQRDAGAGSAINGSYFEIERGINFWQDSKLANLSGMLEYDGATWGSGIFGIGAKYFFHSADFRNTFTIEAFYDINIGYGEADVPLKISGVWGMNDFLGIKKLCFKGFFDFWGNNSVFGNDVTKFSFLTEPQLWYALGEHLNIGGEVELSYNFAGCKGFMCNPCAGLKWNF